MAINLQSLRQSMHDKYGASGSEFDRMFIEAVNRVSLDLYTDVGISEDAITQITGNLSVDSKYFPVYKQGVAYYLGADRQWAKEPEANSFEKYRMAIGQAQVYYQADEGLKSGTQASDWGT